MDGGPSTIVRIIPSPRLPPRYSYSSNQRFSTYSFQTYSPPRSTRVSPSPPSSSSSACNTPNPAQSVSTQSNRGGGTPFSITTWTETVSQLSRHPRVKPLVHQSEAGRLFHSLLFLFSPFILAVSVRALSLLLGWVREGGGKRCIRWGGIHTCNVVVAMV